MRHDFWAFHSKFTITCKGYGGGQHLDGIKNKKDVVKVLVTMSLLTKDVKLPGGKPKYYLAS